jgi:hypothetical protein
MILNSEVFKIMYKVVLVCFFILKFGGAFSQTYFNEFGRRIIKTEYEDKILNGPYFGVPGEVEGDMKLVHRMRR